MWTDRCFKVLRSIHVHPFMEHPPSSQDFNVSEDAWANGWGRVRATAPASIETRKDLGKRLHGVVRPLSISGKDMLTDLCSGFGSVGDKFYNVYSAESITEFRFILTYSRTPFNSKTMCNDAPRFKFSAENTKSRRTLLYGFL